MNTQKIIFATAILLLCTFSANAYGFTVNGLYYNVLPGTGMNDMTIVSIFLYLKDDQLLVNSPVSEIITVYSVSGTLMYTKNKQAGETMFPIGHIPNQLLIVRGSSGWVKKLIQNK